MIWISIKTRNITFSYIKNAIFHCKRYCSGTNKLIESETYKSKIESLLLFRTVWKWIAWNKSMFIEYNYPRETWCNIDKKCLRSYLYTYVPLQN